MNMPLIRIKYAFEYRNPFLEMFKYWLQTIYLTRQKQCKYRNFNLENCQGQAFSTTNKSDLVPTKPI